MLADHIHRQFSFQLPRKVHTGHDQQRDQRYRSKEPLGDLGKFSFSRVEQIKGKIAFKKLVLRS